MATDRGCCKPHTHIHTHRQVDRETDKQTHSHTCGQTNLSCAIKRRPMVSAAIYSRSPKREAAASRQRTRLYVCADTHWLRHICFSFFLLFLVLAPLGLISRIVSGELRTRLLWQQRRQRRRRRRLVWEMFMAPQGLTGSSGVQLHRCCKRMQSWSWKLFERVAAMKRMAAGCNGNWD